MRFVAYCMPLSRCLNVRLDLSDIILVILFVSFGNVSYLCKRYAQPVWHCSLISADKSVKYEKHCINE